MIEFLSLKSVTGKYADEIHEAVRRVVDSGWYLQGAENEAFEKEYADYIGTKCAVGCANGLDALIWILRAYKELGHFKDGDEILVPANTYIAPILAITENNLQAVFVAALVCVYLESGILSAGLPEINGGFLPALAVRSRMIADLSVWLVVFAGFLAAARWARAWLHWVALAFLVLAIASLFDVRREQAPASARMSEGGLSSGFEWQRDVIENFRYSPKRNVLVFILDSMPGNLSYDFVSSDPGMAERFAGFTAFTNNVGMADCTKYGLPGLMTGRYFEPGVSSAADYPMSIFGEESFIVPYVKMGAAIRRSPS